MPASHVSRKLYLNPACLFLAMSGIDHLVEVDAAPRRVDSVHLDGNGIAQLHRGSRVLAHQGGFRLVQVPAVAANSAPGQEAFEALFAEADEGSCAYQPDDL